MKNDIKNVITIIKVLCVVCLSLATFLGWVLICKASEMNEPPFIYISEETKYEEAMQACIFQYRGIYGNVYGDGARYACAEILAGKRVM